MEDQVKGVTIIASKRKSSKWRWLLLVLCILLFYTLLAPDRPIRAINVLFGLDVAKVVSGESN